MIVAATIAVVVGLIVAYLVGRSRGRYQAYVLAMALFEMGRGPNGQPIQVQDQTEPMPAFVQDQRDNAGWQ